MKRPTMFTKTQYHNLEPDLKIQCNFYRNPNSFFLGTYLVDSKMSMKEWESKNSHCNPKEGDHRERTCPTRYQALIARSVWYWHGVEQWFSTKGDFSPREHWATFGCYSWRGRRGCYHHLVGKGQDATKHPTLHRSAPTTKNYHIQTPIVPRLWNPGERGRPTNN